MKADLNKANSQNETPAFWAAYTGRIGVITALVEAKANLDVPAKVSITSRLLNRAKYKGRLVAVEQLFQDHKIDVNLPLEGFTPLHAAIFFGHVDVVKMLLKNGADITQKAGGKISAFDLASAMGIDLELNELDDEGLT